MVNENSSSTRLKFLDGDTIQLDNTALEKFSTCPRSAYYYMIRGRESADDRPALNFGRILHQALYLHHRGTPPVAIEAHVRKAFEEQPNPIDDFRDVTKALDTYRSYCNQYPAEPWEQLSTELAFAHPLGTVTIGGRTYKVLWTGIIDLIVKYFNGLYIVDHKSTSRMGPGYFDQFNNSSQFLGYCWAAQQKTGKPVEGTIINAICISGSKPARFERDQIPFDQERIHEWRLNTLAQVRNFMACHEEDFYPMHTAWCVGKYGRCPYLDVCCLPAEHREALLGCGSYRDVTWNPLTELQPQ